MARRSARPRRAACAALLLARARASCDGAARALLEGLRGRCAAQAGCLPRRMSDPAVAQAGDIADEFEEAMASGQTACEDEAVVAAMAVLGRSGPHMPSGQRAARIAFALAGRGCWPTLGLNASSWPVTYREVAEMALDAEAWEEFGEAAEVQRPPRRAMPPPLLNALTPSVGLGAPRYAGEFPRRIRVLSLGKHASYPAALFGLWRATLGERYVLEPEEHSFDRRYCHLAGTCATDERFAWLSEYMDGVHGETCSGQVLKVLVDLPQAADRLAEVMLSSGGADDATARAADVLLCTHPPYSCRLFLPLVVLHGKPLLGFFGGTLEAQVPADGIRDWLRDFRDLALHPRVQFAAISPFLAEKMRFQTGVDVPATRAFGFHVLDQGMTYFPRRLHDVLLWKNSFECEDNQEDFDRLLDDVEASARAEHRPRLRFFHLRKLREEGAADYKSIGSFRAVVFVPYEVLLMTFYELYHVAIPLFLPEAHFASFFYYRGPVTFPHCSLILDGVDDSGGETRPWPWRPRAPYSPFARESVTARSAWLEEYTDWYRFPHLQHFASLADLVERLHSADLQAISASMRRESEEALVGAVGFWGRAFRKVLRE